MDFIMDTIEEERGLEKTCEVEIAHFETETRRFTIFDEPGHPSHVRDMISGIHLAHIPVLVISARPGEFETGYVGQTRKLVPLALGMDGYRKLLVVINKMDDPTVMWSYKRFYEIKLKMLEFLSRFYELSCYFLNLDTDVFFLPISGLVGSNIKTSVDENTCSWWYDGPCMFDVLDDFPVPERDTIAPFWMPIIDKFEDMGTVVMGTVESGTVCEGDSLLVMPNMVQVTVDAVFIDEDQVQQAGAGENLRITLAGVEEKNISSGFVLSSGAIPLEINTIIEAYMRIVDLPVNTVFSPGYRAVLHIRSAVVDCEILTINGDRSDRSLRLWRKGRPTFARFGACVRCWIKVNNGICNNRRCPCFPLTLCDKGKALAVGLGILVTNEACLDEMEQEGTTLLREDFP